MLLRRRFAAAAALSLALAATGCAKDPSKEVPAAKVEDKAPEAEKPAEKPAEPAAAEKPAEAPAAPTAAAAPAPAAAVPAAFSVPAGSTALTGAVHAIGSKVTGSHELNFKEFTGYFAAKDGKAEGGAIGFEVKVASLEEIVKERTEWVDKFEGHMKSPDFFDVEKFPTATFVSTEIKAGGDPAAAGSTHTIKGNLTLRGTTKETTFPATIAINGKEVTGKAEFSINRKDFGIVYAGKPADLIRDGVVLKLDLKGSM